MTNKYTSSTLLNTYYDDYKDSDQYAKILFNTGRALQARELTQLQTIVQKQIERFGRNIFKEGAAVNPGGLTVNNQYEFIKLASNTTFPSDTSVLVGTEFTGQTSGVKFKVLEVVEAENSDPPTLYVSYTDTSLATSGAQPIRIFSGENIDNGSYDYNVQTTNTTVNPAVGRGTRVSFGAGDFFTQGFFVFAPAQSKIISKYTNNPTVNVGFLVTQDIVTTSDNDALYDNSNQLIPNLSAPGADRFRIKLAIAIDSEIDSDQNFVYISRIENGAIVDEVDGKTDYNIINDLLALRTREESGDYNVKQFKIKFEENDSDNTKLTLNISDGISYVDGYRAAVDYPTKIIVDKAQSTITKNNEVIAANYGNYLLAYETVGLPNINEFEIYNLRGFQSYGGATIGTARIRSVQVDGDNIRYYIFDIKMINNRSFREVRSVGTSVNRYFNVVLENGQAVLKQAGSPLFFQLPTTRPSSISDISLTTLRRFVTTTNGSGQATLTLTGAGETFANSNDWITANADSDRHTGFSVSGIGTQSVTISNGPASSSNYEVLAYVNKSAASVRTKTLTETTVTDTIDSDGNGLNFLNLGVADIYDVSRIRLTDSDGNDVSNRFILDNGQRDNFYALGRLILRSGSIPSGNIFARFRYFQHGTSGDFFAVNSYTSQIAYEDIPAYRATNGSLIQLRDVLDFRPVQNASTTYSGGNARINELPQTTNLITADIVYYQPKFGILVIDTESNLKFIEGPSSLNPIVPPTPENSLSLYRIRMNPFTLNDSDVSVTKIENKRYTMADIGKLEARVDNLEDLTTLSLLELDTNNFDVLDSSGLNRTKAGFIVDNFKDHFFANTTSIEYSASIDPNARIMRPSFNTESIRLIYDSDLSSNTILKGDNVYVKHSETAQIRQPLATETINVNPFSVITHLGDIELSPASDNFSDVVRIPARVIEGESPVDRNLSRNWNNWQWNWGGAGPASEVNNFNNGSVTTRIDGSRLTTTVREVINDRTVNVTFLPFMRSIKVYFKAVGLMPNTKFFAFFDDVSVSNWVREETFTRFSTNTTEYGNSTNNLTQHPDGPTPLISNDEGVIEGSFFIPNNNSIKFRAGSRVFKLLNVSSNIDSNATSIVQTIFTSRGILETRQQEIVSTRLTRNIPPQNDESRANPNDRDYSDPLAQSFLVSNPNGIFITSVDIYFATKDTKIPVQVQIRPMSNGSPSSREIVPSAQKFLSPASVNTSSNATIPTRFTFDEPVFLPGLSEYAIVILAESTEYNVFVAKTNEFLIGSTEQRVKKQPTLGSLFVSQNGSTWTPDQTKDLTFNLYRASFSTSPSTAVLENASVPIRLLNVDPISVDSGSSTVTVSHINHGFIVGDEITINGLDSAESIGGISNNSISGTRTITALDWTGYQFNADSSATFNDFGGRNNVTATTNIPFDIFVPSIDTLVPNDTSVSFKGKFTTGKSFAGSESPYQKSANAIDISVFDNNVMNEPYLIISADNEETELGAGARSATVEVSMSTNTNRVAPVIDLQRCSLTLIGNMIDKQDSSATVGFNVPLNYVPETDPLSGTSAAKHITIPVTLEEDAVGLKILIGAHRPSAATFDVYYRVSSDGVNLVDQPWVLIPVESEIPSDENPNIYRDYEYLVGGQSGSLLPFTQFQIKIVMNSINSSKVPVFRDLRVIALSV
jgi:hypothetical protein